jgi:hypothetical protein
MLISEHSFKTTDVANMMDSQAEDAEEDARDTPASHESSSEPDRDAGDIVSTTVGYSRASIRGLQQVLAQGWLIPRARDMCGFTHDKYRQAATHMASQLPDLDVMHMCLKVIYSGTMWAIN